MLEFVLSETSLLLKYRIGHLMTLKFIAFLVQAVYFSLNIWFATKSLEAGKSSALFFAMAALTLPFILFSLAVMVAGR
jgi:hypothetical protein